MSAPTPERLWQSETLIFKTCDHPEAKGAKSKTGDVEYTPTFPLEDGRILIIRMGQFGFDNFTQLLLGMLTNAPQRDDGSLGRNIMRELADAKAKIETARLALSQLEQQATKFTIGCNCQGARADDELSASLEIARSALAALAALAPSEQTKEKA